MLTAQALKFHNMKIPLSRATQFFKFYIFAEFYFDARSFLTFKYLTDANNKKIALNFSVRIGCLIFSSIIVIHHSLSAHTTCPTSVSVKLGKCEKEKSYCAKKYKQFFSTQSFFPVCFFQLFCKNEENRTQKRIKKNEKLLFYARVNAKEGKKIIINF